MKRADDFQKRREHLIDLTDEQLKERFWQLASQMVEPLIDLATKNTTPSIERSVLLRMGFSSLEAKGLVEGVMDRGLMGKGAGHVVYILAKERNISIRDAGLALLEDNLWNEVLAIFEGGNKV
ncbi:MAG: ornithine aminomutase subunit alpha [Alkaliphilus sp.]|nr:ornithine aminomutase subunit alpha [Alkaliphilus sp.]